MSSTSETFCILPWIYLLPWPNGSLRTCCEGKKDLAKVKNGLSVELLNHPTMIEIRKSMLEGKWHENCLDCKIKEEAGFKSSRTTANKNLNHMVLPELGTLPEDGVLPNPKIYYLELRLSNLCNFRCRTCNHESSSAWYEDELALAEAGLIAEKPFNKITDTGLEIETILPLLKDIKSILFVGGEPLLDKRILPILKELKALGRSDEVYISFITNMSELNPHNEIIKLLHEGFKRKSFVLSLDAMGKRAEYIRSGTNWDSISENLEFFLDEFSHRDHYNIHCTYSLFNAYHIIEFHKWITEGLGIPKDKFVFNPAVGPEHISASILPTSRKIELIEAYSNYQGSWNDIPSNRIRNTFDGTIHYLSQSLESSPQNNKRLKEFF
jgi:sulfatase maturation enzyme AslB (radical SAM superfamily)